MAQASLIISSRNYSSWCLRGWLLMRMSGIEFVEEKLASDDATAQAELLLRSSSIRIPTLLHDGLRVWDTLAIAEYLHEIRPEAGMYPQDPVARAHCRSISGEMHSGFVALRSSLPFNLRARLTGFPIWSSVRGDIERVTEIWRECLTRWGGPFLFGARMTVADAMYAPVCTRFETYGVDTDPASAGYQRHILALPDMQQWREAALEEAEPVSELEPGLDAEF